MRIVRPGSVVGPQQQYMYVKQLEWAKWAAVDEMRKEEAQTAAAMAVSSVVTPATPPAEADDEDPMDITDVEAPSTPKNKVHIPPVTPSKHVAAATARARQITPPGQPRKTPVAKRTATVAAVDEDNDEDNDEEEDELDVLPALHTAAATRARLRTTPQSKPATRAGLRRIPPASEQRPTRVTRSTVRPPIKAAGATKETGGRAVGNIASPNKIPRLAHTQTAPVGGPGMSVVDEKTLPAREYLLHEHALAATATAESARGLSHALTAPDARCWAKREPDLDDGDDGCVGELQGKGGERQCAEAECHHPKPVGRGCVDDGQRESGSGARHQV